MCGVAALVSLQPTDQAAGILAMCDVIRHRGPDGEGYALFGNNGVCRLVLPSREPGASGFAASKVALGHRRLAIVDLSEAASQPMSFGPEQRYWITYNGEVYNFPEVRKELEGDGYYFQSNSDTEVVLAAYMAWGTECLSRFNGMFAFVLYDRVNDRVFAARDRYGVKPIYWWRAPDGTVAFASEIKQFTVLPGWRARLDGQRAYDYLNWGLTDHSDGTMFRDVHQIPPGHFIELAVDDTQRGFKAKQWYGVTGDVAVDDFEIAASQFRQLFLDSVKLRLRADVEVGTALSGGLDSSSIVCAADRLRNDQAGGLTHTFSARARDAAFDEGRFIEVVTGAVRAIPHMVYPEADGLFADLDDLIWHHDEPFGSTSVYAEWRVFRLAQEACIKVMLDGHGADEILAGYVNFIGPHLGELFRRGRLLALMHEVGAQRRLHGRSYSFLIAALADDLLPQWLRDVSRDLAGYTVSKPDWIDLDYLGAQPRDPFAAVTRHQERGINGLSISQLTAISLPMQLKWADRDSMAHSVESRAPFLDHRLVGYTVSMPAEYKICDGMTKQLLRTAMKGILPHAIVERRDKLGFVTPEELWVRRDCPGKFREILRNAVAAAGGVLTPRAFEIGNAIIDGRMPFHSRLWRMICFGEWIKRFGVRVEP